MDNYDEFITFIKTIPSIKEDVISHKYTWQQIYEIYTLYGKDDDFFKTYKNHQDLNNIFEILKNIDMEALSQSLQSLEKILNLAYMFVDNKGKHES